ncbi:hypothetical protein CHH62_02170 [Niallia circulans]|uniref:hypothetical protein n=1 Tax=Niallia circulans TaxID=1397 RepID=UPI000BA5C4EC|nr:hypothetical protein [Niallia circulans]PAD27366.1 hypothetical protein CHH62_02170 [Niallia circulans]
MLRIELICHEIKRLMDDYYKCQNAKLKKQIQSDIKLLSNVLYLSDLPDEYHEAEQEKRETI